MNSSFYSLQRPESYRACYEATPKGFVFSIKGSHVITYMKRLKKIETPPANSFASGLLRLGDKLGPILWPLPPSFLYDRERLSASFAKLRRDTRGSAALARKHNGRLRGRSWMQTDQARSFRHAEEVRQPLFETADFVSLPPANDFAMASLTRLEMAADRR